ncbi:hypothetical protein [Spirillospora sp. NPDC029432]|uniref:hypothetical protein n=1 Tax=Spirillospora sp. NPDC029432 TaxID=3154599 RepID=UPI003455F6A2
MPRGAAASRRPDLQASARVWSQGLAEVLAPRIGPQAARAVTTFIDGALLHALVDGRPPDTTELAAALAALTGPPLEPHDQEQAAQRR